MSTAKSKLAAVMEKAQRDIEEATLAAKKEFAGLFQQVAAHVDGLAGDTIRGFVSEPALEPALKALGLQVIPSGGGDGSGIKKATAKAPRKTTAASGSKGGTRGGVSINDAVLKVLTDEPMATADILAKVNHLRGKVASKAVLGQALNKLKKDKKIGQPKGKRTGKYMLA